MRKKKQFIAIAGLVFLLGYFIRKFDVLSYFKSISQITILGSPLKDFGTLNKGDKAVFYFKFTNTGSKDLKITNIETKCGCTIPSWNNNFIEPQQTDSIKVVYDTDIVGPFNRSINIYSNAEKNPEYLHIKGVVKD